MCKSPVCSVILTISRGLVASSITSQTTSILDGERGRRLVAREASPSLRSRRQVNRRPDYVKRESECHVSCFIFICPSSWLSSRSMLTSSRWSCQGRLASLTRTRLCPATCVAPSCARGRTARSQWWPQTRGHYQPARVLPRPESNGSVTISATSSIPGRESEKVALQCNYVTGFFQGCQEMRPLTSFSS